MLRPTAMRPRLAVLLFAALALAAAGGAKRQLALPAVGGHAVPYTITVPADWKPREIPGAAWLLIGPAGARPEIEPRLLHVLPQREPLDDPEGAAAAIRTADAAAADWSAPVVEVREVAGVRGVLVRMETGEGEAARTVLALRLPAGEGSVALTLSAPRAEFARLEPLFTSILSSVRRAPPARRGR